jgi:acyl-coenzyme A synthetase/AMP-(fatty) acid ligase
MDLARYAVFKARTQEETPAIAFAGGVATYGHLMRAVESTLVELEALSIPSGGLVAININNPFHHTVVMLALCLAGLPSASVSSVAHVQHAGVVPAACLTDRPNFELPGSRNVTIDDGWFLIDPTRPVDYTALLSRAGFGSKDEVVRVVFSSGTTGVPKAVAMTGRVLETSMAHGELAQAGPHTHSVRALNMMGFSTVGSIIAVLIVLSRGGLIAFTYSPGDALNLIRAFQIEILSCAVGQLQSLLQTLGDRTGPPSLKTLIASGSKIPRPLLMEARARLCTNVNVMYGSTEAGPITFGTGAALDFAEGAAGHLLPWVTLEVVDEQDRAVTPGADGIIRIRSDEQSHYLNPSPQTDALFRDGWFYPGDVGKLYPDGLVVITGRVNEVINRGGQIVAPESVEAILSNLPGVKDVAVFGVPDPTGLEQIWAAIVSDQWVDAHGMREIVGARMPDRRPDHIIQVDSIPRNEMGKIRRHELRQDVLAKRNGGKA